MLVRMLSKDCDSVGARTRDLLLRRQLLYPTELPNRPFYVCGCKGRHFFANCKILDRKSYI